ncbi:MAG: pyruvate kinase [Bacteroidota bacterium]
MKEEREKYKKLRDQLARLIEAVLAESEAKENGILRQVDPAFAESARNLLHYRALRRFDLRKIQQRLRRTGLSRLARSESNVLDSLKRSHSILSALAKDKKIRFEETPLSVQEADQWLKLHARDLIGKRHKGRRARIMVTMPAHAATDYDLVRNMVSLGMDVARINCAHDDAETWLGIIRQIRLASKKAGREVKVAMDLAGPKIRTGGFYGGVRVRKYRPQRDERGRSLAGFRIWLAEQAEGADSLPVAGISQLQLTEGDKLYLLDARNKKRSLTIESTGPGGYWALGKKTTYFESGLAFYRDKSFGEAVAKVGLLPPQEAVILLQEGDDIRIHAEALPGEAAKLDKDGTVLSPAHISCTEPQVLKDVKLGESVYFDDGKIKGQVKAFGEGEILVEILQTPARGGKLKADKGINFPDSVLTVSGLTDKDREDLPFVVEHADLVNFSFVNSAEDVEDLLEEIARLRGSDKVGVVLKIETQRAYHNLTNILLTAMRHYPIGVMIARGDLAIECGWENIARIQEEILSLCRAAHVPDIWATQVLESLAKSGLPSRAEITDAAKAQRADAVMLNKGPYILNAIRLLDKILRDLAAYQDKGVATLPALEREPALSLEE